MALPEHFRLRVSNTSILMSVRLKSIAIHDRKQGYPLSAMLVLTLLASEY